jgi:TMEM175 potassium channel family protein
MNIRHVATGLFRVGSMSVGRIEAFSDGVFAIVVTLLVLEIHVPRLTGPNISVALIGSLRAMLPKFLSYVLSFMIVCVWWVAHHHLFHVLRRSDRGLLWFNSMYLLWLAFIPFPTALLGDYPRERVAVMCYGGVMLLTGLSFSWMRYYAFFIADLARADLDRNLMRKAMVKSALNPVLHAIAVVLALVSTKLAIGLLVAIPLMFFLPSKLEKTHLHAASSPGVTA